MYTSRFGVKMQIKLFMVEEGKKKVMMNTDVLYVIHELMSSDIALVVAI